MGSLYDYVTETLQLTSKTTELGEEAMRHGSSYEADDSMRWEYVFRIMTTSQGILQRLALEIDNLAAKIGEGDG